MFFNLYLCGSSLSFASLVYFQSTNYIQLTNSKTFNSINIPNTLYYSIVWPEYLYFIGNVFSYDYKCKKLYKKINECENLYEKNKDVPFENYLMFNSYQMFSKHPITGSLINLYDYKLYDKNDKLIKITPMFYDYYSLIKYMEKEGLEFVGTDKYFFDEGFHNKIKFRKN